MIDNTFWHAILSVSSAILCACLLAGCIHVVHRAHRRLASLEPRLRFVESRCSSFKESIDTLSLELERLANRVKMQKVRNVTEHSAGTMKPNGGEPNPATDPELWRAWQNKQLRPTNV